ncbi:MAG: hypothetical protein GY790_09960, partial [Bacteroidetes bacterium]|nr:hypothetical protein [Bacteroidota bacterium]
MENRLNTTVVFRGPGDARKHLPPTGPHSQRGYTDKRCLLYFQQADVYKAYRPGVSGAEDLAGAEIILRKNVWRYDPYPVTSVEGTVVNILNDQKPTAKKGDENLQEAGYFFQKHLNTLD